MSLDINILFPKVNKLTNNFKTDDVGKYSITKPNDALKITNIIKEVYESLNNQSVYNLIITDGTSGIGGNTISFCKHFRSPIYFSSFYNYYFIWNIFL